MRLAVTADIHGNEPALAAVLDAIAEEGVDGIIDLGDALNGPIDPAGVLRRLRTVRPVHVRGNGDRMILEAPGAGASRSARFARERLSPDDLAYLADWPERAGLDGLVAFHGSPRSDTEYLLEDVASGSGRPRTPPEIRSLLGLETAPLILCGHSHLPRTVALPDGRLVVNPGSVGLPAYADDLPVPHRMEAGSPHARYAVIERTGGRWSASLRAVAYDWERAAAIAAANQFPDWVRPLRTGYA
jgi:predicted phosphodiesterase